jgi:hypothetical protein
VVPDLVSVSGLLRSAEVIDIRLSGKQNRYGRHGERQSLFPPGIEHRFSGHPARNLVLVVSMLYRLLEDIEVMRRTKSVLAALRMSDLIINQ